MQFKVYLLLNRLTIQEVAKTLGVHKSYLSQVINGINPGGKEFREKIIAFTNGQVSMRELRKPYKERKRPAQED